MAVSPSRRETYSRFRHMARCAASFRQRSRFAKRFCKSYPFCCRVGHGGRLRARTATLVRRATSFERSVRKTFWVASRLVPGERHRFSEAAYVCIVALSMLRCRVCDGVRYCLGRNGTEVSPSQRTLMLARPCGCHTVRMVRRNFICNLYIACSVVTVE